MKKIITMLLVFLCSYSTVIAQAKVGTTGAQFLELPLSVKSIGMGEAGVAVVSKNSFYLNPSHLGLMSADKNITLSTFPTPLKLSSDVSYINFSIALPLVHIQTSSQNLYFGAAFYYTGLSSGTFIERTYERGTIEGTGRTFSWGDNAKNVVLGFASTGNFDFGFGVTAKYISQSSLDYTANSVAFDIGGMISKKINYRLHENVSTILIPSFGVSIQNLGSDMKFITNEFPLPTSKLVGFSLAIIKQKQFNQNNNANIFSITPVLDIEKRRDDSWLYKQGIDFSVYEVINFRLGRITTNGSSDPMTTYGFSLSTFSIGKFKLLTTDGDSSQRGEVGKLLYEKFNIEYNFAQYESSNIVTNRNYHEIVVSYGL